MFLDTESIIVEERIRKSFPADELAELADSMVRLSQLQPIVVEQRNGTVYLVAGERRLRAVQLLASQGKAPRNGEVGKIRAEFQTDLSEHTRLFIEFDENVKRRDFDFVEKARFIRRFHETMEGKADGKWTAEMTAATLGLSAASISHYLRIEEAIKTDPLVAKATTMNAAVKRMKVTEKTKARQIEAKESGTDTLKKASEILILGDAIELIKSIPDESIDCINFDPPWGDETGHKANDNWEGFEDDTETSDEVINALLPELYRVLKNDRVMIYWYRAWAYNDMIARLEKIGFNFKFTRTPCIWVKPDKVSDQNRFPEKMLITAYETFLLARKGDPLLHDRNAMNVFAYNRVQKSALIHPTEKPVDLCDRLLKICTVSGERVLDPTAGSGAFLYSAIRNDRRAVGFELGPQNHARAVLRLADLLKTRKEA